MTFQLVFNALFVVLAQQIRRNLYEQIQNEKLFAIHMCDIQERSIQSKIKHCKLLLSHVTGKKREKKKAQRHNCHGRILSCLLERQTKCTKKKKKLNYKKRNRNKKRKKRETIINWCKNVLESPLSAVASNDLFVILCTYQFNADGALAAQNTPMHTQCATMTMTMTIITISFADHFNEATIKTTTMAFQVSIFSHYTNNKNHNDFDHALMQFYHRKILCPAIYSMYILLKSGTIAIS